MPKKKKLTIQGLVSVEFTPLIDDTVASFKDQKDLDQEKLQKFLSSRKKANEFYTSLEDNITDFFLKRFTIDEFRKQHEISKRNSQTIVNLHEDLFQYFFAYIHTTHLIYRNFISHMLSVGLKASELETKDLINLVMYGNLCRMGDQIGIQLINGYPDAALILWRTFYEYCAVAIFLLHHDSNELATRFRDFSEKENKRKIDSYVKRYKDMKFPPLDPEVISKTTKNYERLEKKYGKEFFQNDYTWAQPFMKIKANFMAIEEAAGFGRFRPFYIWASSKAHPTYLGVTDFKDSTNATVLEYILEQKVERRSFVDPSQLTLNIFHQVNDHFLYSYSGHEYEINMKMLGKIYDMFGESLSEEKVAKTDSVNSRKST